MLLAGGPAVPQASPFCTLCPVGTFSPGGSREQCRPCPFNTTSAAGSDSSASCVFNPDCMPTRPDCTSQKQFQAVNVAAGQALAGLAIQQQAAARSALWAHLALEKACSPACPAALVPPHQKVQMPPLTATLLTSAQLACGLFPGSISDPPSSAAECICREGYGGGVLV